MSKKQNKLEIMAFCVDDDDDDIGGGGGSGNCGGRGKMWTIICISSVSKIFFWDPKS